MDVVQFLNSIGPLVNTIGLPLFILIIVSLTIWRLAVWAEAKVVIPLLKAHVMFIKTLTEKIPEHSDRLKQLIEGQKDTNALIVEQTTTLKTALESRYRKVASPGREEFQ